MFLNHRFLTATRFHMRQRFLDACSWKVSKIDEPFVSLKHLLVKDGLGTPTKTWPPDVYAKFQTEFGM